MKKFLSLMLVALMFLSTLALTSCNIESILKEYLPFLVKEPVYTVTKEEWDSNIAMDNFSINVVSIAANGSEHYSFYYASNNVSKSVSGSGDEKNVFYYVLEDDVTYTIMEYRGKTSVSKNSFLFDLSLKGLLGDWFDFEDFEYNEEEKCYVCCNELLVNPNFEFKIYFENGVIKSIYINTSNEHYKQIVTYNICNIGTTVIEVPEFTRPK